MKVLRDILYIIIGASVTYLSVRQIILHEKEEMFPDKSKWIGDCFISPQDVLNCDISDSSFKY